MTGFVYPVFSEGFRDIFDFERDIIMNTDTIAAIATALSDSGIGIVRISGENAIAVGDAVFLSF